MTKEDAVYLGLVVAMALLISILLFVLEPEPPTYDYQYGTINGMPCFKLSQSRREALTCDWSKWNGSTEGVNQ